MQLQKGLTLQLLKFNDVMETSFADLAPHKIVSIFMELSKSKLTVFITIPKSFPKKIQNVTGYISLIMLAKNLQQPSAYWESRLRERM